MKVVVTVSGRLYELCMGRGLQQGHWSGESSSQYQRQICIHRVCLHGYDHCKHVLRQPDGLFSAGQFCASN